MPKHHLSGHLGDCHHRLVGCLPHERKHKLVKRWSKDRYTTKSFERGIMEELTLEHLADLEKEWMSPGLVEPRKPESALLREFQNVAGCEFQQVMCSRKARVCHGSLVYTGDVAWASVDGDRCLVEVKSHFEADGHHMTMVCVWDSSPQPSDSAWAATFRKVDQCMAVPTDCLIASAIFLQGQADHVTALVPPFFRA